MDPAEWCFWVFNFITWSGWIHAPGTTLNMRSFEIDFQTTQKLIKTFQISTSNGFLSHRSFGHKIIYQNYHLDDTGNILCVIVWMKFMVSEAINSVFYTLSIDCILNCPLGTVCPILPTAFQVYTKVCISRPS